MQYEILVSSVLKILRKVVQVTVNSNYKERSLLNYVPFVPQIAMCLRAYVPYITTYLRAYVP